jgi:hypothetical protein
MQTTATNVDDCVDCYFKNGNTCNFYEKSVKNKKPKWCFVYAINIFEDFGDIEEKKK